MRVLNPAILLLLFSSLSALARAENLKIGRDSFAPLQAISAREYSVEITARNKLEKKFKELVILFAHQGVPNYYRLKLTKTTAVVEKYRDNNLEDVWEGKGRILHSDSKNPDQMIEIRRQVSWITVVVNHVIALRVLDLSYGSGEVYVRMQEDLEITRFRVQPLDPIIFDDDFMKTAEAAEDLGVWKPESGSWRIQSIDEKVRATGLKISNGKAPESERSPNPFSLSSLGIEPSIITSGQSFWSDYAFEVSSKTESGWFGVVFCWRGPQDHFVFRAQLLQSKKHAGTLQLVRVKDGETDVLEERHFIGRTGDWYRIQVSAVGGRIRASMDDALVFDVYDDTCSGGKIGLYSEGGYGTAFDDVAVRSDAAIHLDRKDEIEKLGKASLGQWKIIEEKDGLTIECRRGGPSKTVGKLSSKPGHFDLWNSSLAGLRFEADIDVSNSRAAGLGIISQIQGKSIRNAYLVNSKGEFELHKDSVPLPRECYPIRMGKKLHLALDFNPGNESFYVNGIKVHHFQGDAPSDIGKLFLYGEEGAVFSNISVNGKDDRNWSQNVSKDAFVEDPYMQGWASPKWAWYPAKLPDEKSEPATWLYKGDCLGAVELSIPMLESTWFWGAEEADIQTGRGVKISQKANETRQVIFLDKGEVKKSIDLPVSKDEEGLPLEIFSDGYYTWIKHHSHTKAVLRHDTLTSGIRLGAIAPMSFDFYSVKVRRDKVQDYLFERASKDWSRVGTWEVTNRFACDPRWSHMNGRSPGLAALWNKHRFEGDFSMEVYAGMRMRHGELLQGFHQWYNYPRIGDINFSFCADGRDVFSGYTMILAEWDRDWSEKYSRLYRQGRKVAETDRQLIPSVRIEQRDERAIPLDWDPGGRGVHGAWYYLKLRRRNGLIEYFFDNQKVLEYRDNSPIDSGRIALWTQNNSIVVARTQIAYKRCIREKLELIELPHQKKSEPETTSNPEFVIHSLTHPYHHSNFENSLAGWQPLHEDQSAQLSVDSATRAEGKHSLRLENMHAGGDFGALIPMDRGDLSRVKELSFFYRIPESVKVNLYFDLEGHPYRTFFVRLTGNDDSNIAMTKLGDFEVTADGEWHQAVFELGRAIRALLPNEVHHIVNRMKIGNLHEGYLNAGLGGNQAGLVYHIDDFLVTSAGPETVNFEFEPEDPDTINEFVWSIDEQPDMKSLKPGPNLKTSRVEIKAAEIEISKAAKGNRSRPSKPVLEKASPPHFAAPATEKLPPGNWYLHVQGIRGDGSKTALAHRQIGVETQTRVAQLSPAANAAWGGEPIQLRFPDKTTAAPILETMQLFMRGQQVPLGDPISNYNANTRTLTLTLNHLEKPCEPGQPVPFELKFEDCLQNAAYIPRGPKPRNKQLTFWYQRPTADPKTPRKVDDVSKLISHKWSYSFETSADKTPPSRVHLSGRLMDLDFEENLGGITTSNSVQGAILERDSATAAEGTYSLKITNPAFGSEVNSSFFNNSFNLGAYPIFSFDYRTEGKLRMNFYTQAGGAGRYIKFTDPEGASSAYISDIDLQTDGKWHHAEINLQRAATQRLSSSFNQKHFEARALSLADFGHRANLAGESLHLDNVTMTPAISTHQEVTFTWKANDLSGIKGYSYGWSQTQAFEPPLKVDTSENSSTFIAQPEGERWFHIRAVDFAGNWGPTRHYRYIIDSTPPNITAVLPAEGAKSISPYVAVQLRDNVVGVNPVTLALSLNGQPVNLQSGHARMMASGDLRYDWAQAQAPMTAPIPDGTAMNYEIKPFFDFVGNQAEGRAWTWNIDYSKDKSGPSSLSVGSPSAQMLSYSDFTSSYGSWSGPTASLYQDPERNDKCLQVTVNDPLGKSAFSLSQSFYSHQQHLMTFDYKFPPGLNLMLKLYGSDKHYYIIGLTGESDIHKNIGMAEGIVADGKWRKAVIDIQAIIKAAYPDVTSWSIRNLSFGCWSRGNPNPIGTTYFLDNIAIQGSGSPAPIFSWNTWDVTGISGFSYLLDRQPATEPDDTIDSSDIRKAFAVLDTPGFWYFHLKARDGAGNWSQTAHYPYYTTSLPPTAPADSYEASEGWLAVAETPGSTVTAQPVKTINGKNTLLSVDWQPPAASQLMHSRFMHPVKGMAGKTRITLRAFNQSKHAITLYPLLDNSDETFFYGRPITITQGTWEPVYTVSLLPENYQAATKTRPLPKLDLSKVTNFGFRIYNTRDAGSMLLEDVKVE